MPAAPTRKAAMVLLAIGLAVGGVGVLPAGAAEATVRLGTAASFAVLGGSTVTNTGPSVISGDLGVSPGTAVTGFPPGTVSNGTIHAADAVADQAQLDLTAAYNDAAGRSASAAVTADLGGQTLLAGVYSGPTLGLTGTLTLDAQGDPDAVFVFQAGSTLITGSTSVVALANGAQACNVFWQVGSSSTLGTNSSFVGSILASTSITANAGVSVEGRLLARNGAVTLDSNTITQAACAVAPQPTSSTTTSSTTTSSTTTSSTTTSSTTTTSTTVIPTSPGTGTQGGDGTPVGDLPDNGGSDATDNPLRTTGAGTSGGGTPGAETPGGAVPRLPETGSGPLAMTTIGLLAMAAGSALSVSARRRELP